MLPRSISYDGILYQAMALRNPAGEPMLAGFMRDTREACENRDNAAAADPVNQQLTAHPQDKVPAIVVALAAVLGEDGLCAAPGRVQKPRPPLQPLNPLWT